MVLLAARALAWAERCVCCHACHRLAEHQQLLAVQDAITRLSRTPDAEVRCAVSRAAASLASAELEGQLPEGSCLEPLVGVMTALLGPEQPSEVQRQQMQVRLCFTSGSSHQSCASAMLWKYCDALDACHTTFVANVGDNAVWYWQALRRLTVLNSHALDPHLAALVPSVCALLQSTSGPTKLAAERTLARLLRVGCAWCSMRGCICHFGICNAPVDARMHGRWMHLPVGYDVQLKHGPGLVQSTASLLCCTCLLACIMFVRNHPKGRPACACRQMLGRTLCKSFWPAGRAAPLCAPT